jgi:nicotinamide-nucleotide amidase
VRAEILSCGTELLLGQITDTNATYLAQSLASLGIDLFFVSQIGDNQERIVETLHRAWQRSDLIVMTGGLGPTEDDLTRESISAMLCETMRVDSVLEANLRNTFASPHFVMLERNVKQATLILSAQALPNPIGIAPGWWVEKDGHIIVVMPGVPREMYRMWDQEVIPRLSPYTGALIFTRVLRVWGLGDESAVEMRLDSVIHSDNPTIATYARPDAIDVRITAKAQTRTLAEQQVAEMEDRARHLLGHHVFGVEKETLQGVVSTYLSTRHRTLAVMESHTGGLLSSVIADYPGSSTQFMGGIVAYSPELQARVGMPREIMETYGVISERAAVAMAHAVREYLGADYGLGMTGVAGPDTREDKPAGTVFIAIEGLDGVVTGTGPGWRAGRDDNRRLAVLTALNLLRLHLEGSAPRR